MVDAEQTYVVRAALVVLEGTQSPDIISAYLEDLGVSKVSVRDSGKAAWEAALAFPYDMVVMGWQLAELNGLALFNRVRQVPQYLQVPVLVVSSQLKPEEFALLAEYPCGRLISEHLTRSNLGSAFGSVVEEASWYLRNGALIDSLLDFAEKDASQALALLKTPLAKAPNPAPLALLIARKLRENDFLNEAERVLQDHLRQNQEGPVALGELGKVLYLKSQYREAMQSLDRAHALSSKNVARLCLLGEIDLTLANPNLALSRFARALEIDFDNPTSKVGVQLLKENRGRSLGSIQVPMPHALASMLNIAAIANVRHQRFDEGIAGYTAALNLVTDRLARVKLNFNLGMGFLRWGKLDKALEYFRSASDMADGAFEKATRYIKLVEERRKKLGIAAPEPEFTITDEVMDDLAAIGEDAAVIEEEQLFS